MLVARQMQKLSPLTTEKGITCPISHPRSGRVPVLHVPTTEALPAAVLLSQLLLPSSPGSAACPTPILHTVAPPAARKLLFHPTALLCFSPTGASGRRPSPALLPASLSLAAPPCPLRPHPEFTTELKHVDNCVGRRYELLSFSTAISPAPAWPRHSGSRYHQHRPCCLRGATGHPSPPLPPLQRGPGDGCWSSHCPILWRMLPEMYPRDCTCIKGWSPGHSAAWACHCRTTGQGHMLVHSLVGKIPWSFPATLQRPCAGAQASSTPWRHTCFGLVSPRLLPGAPPPLLRPPAPHRAPAPQAARLGSQCGDGCLPATPTPLSPLVLEKPPELVRPGTSSLLAAPSQAPELGELGQPHFKPKLERCVRRA